MIITEILSTYFLIIGLVCIGCVPIVRRVWPKNISKWFCLLLIACSLWSFISLMQINSPPSIKDDVYVIGLSVGITTTLFWLFFSLEYAGKKYHKSKYVKLGSISIFIFIILLKLTNFHHSLYFTSSINTQPFVYLTVDREQIYYLTLLLSYVISAYGFYIIYQTLEKSMVNTLKHKLALSPLFVPFFIELLSIIYTDSFVLNFAYESLGVALFSIGFVIASSEEINSVDNIAKNQLVDNVNTPILVTNMSEAIIYCNDSFKKMVDENQISKKDIIKNYESSECDIISIPSNNRKKYFNINKDPIFIGSRKMGYSYILIDLTEIVIKNKILNKQKDQNVAISDACRHHLRNQTMLINAYTPEDNSQVEKSLEKLYSISKNVPDIIDYSQPAEKIESICIDDILKNTETDIDIHNPDKLNVLGTKDKIVSLFTHCIEYGEINSSENIYLTISESTINLTFDNGKNFDTGIIKSVKEHGEIESDMICLNKIYLLSESLFWEMKYKQIDDRVILQFETINNISEPNNECDIDVESIL